MSSSDDSSSIHSTMKTGEGYDDYYIKVGKFNDTGASSVFRPSTISPRVGDRIEFQYTSVLNMFNIVQAKSAEEPCTPLRGGLFAEAGQVTDEMRNDPDIDSKMGYGYGWYVPNNASESTIHFYAEGQCEQGMRAQFFVSGIATGSPMFRDSPHGYDYVPEETGLSKSRVIGISVGVTVAVLLLLAVLLRFLFRRNRAKKTQEMKGRVGQMIEGAQVVAHDNGLAKSSV